MADIFNVEPPRWLQERTSHGFELGQEAGSLAGALLGSGIKSATTGENFFTVFKDAVNTAQQKSMLDLQEKQLQIRSQTEEIAAQKEDAPIWMNYQSAALKDPSTPQPAWQSQKYQTMGQQFDWKLQSTEIQKMKVQNQLDYQKQLEQQKADALSETKSNNAIRAGIAQDRADTYKDKNQYFKSGSDIYKVNPDTQELEKVVTGKDSKVSADDSLELLNKRTMLQSKLESLTRGGGFGIHWNKTLKPDDQKTVAIYQKQIDDINQKLGMGSDESGTQGGSEAPVTSRFKILEVK